MNRIFQDGAWRITALAWVAQIMLSWPLWSCQGRDFPLFYGWGGIGEGNVGLNTLLTVLLLISLIVSVIRPESLTSGRITLALLALMVMIDLNRMQVWVWFYALLWIGRYGFPSAATPAFSLLLLSAVYTWGGAQKFSIWYVEEIHPWFCSAYDWSKPFARMGYSAAALECLMGIMLLWPATRKPGAILALIMHIYIVVALGPTGLNWNLAVIPWNIAMATLVLHLAWNVQVNLLKSKTLKYGQIALLALAWLAPAANASRWWPESMSWKMYADLQPEANIVLNQPLINHSSTVLQSTWDRHDYDEGRRLLIDDWAFASLKTPAFESERHWEKVAGLFCSGVADSVHLWILRPQRWSRTYDESSVPVCQ